MKYLKALIYAGVAFVLMGLAFAWTGIYNIAADEPHTAPVYLLLQMSRNQSIQRRANDIEVPDGIAQKKRLTDGALLYAGHCEQCHLGPGLSSNGLQQGLNPSPPRLDAEKHNRPLQEQFWIVKHGIKMTGMPAWGETFPDDALWAIVAFADQLPRMTAETYQRLTLPADERP